MREVERVELRAAEGREGACVVSALGLLLLGVALMLVRKVVESLAA